MTEEIRPKGMIEKIIDDHGRKIFIAGIVFIVLIGGWAWYTYRYFPKKSKDGSEALFMVQKYFERDSIGPVLNGTDEAMGAIDIADEYSGTKAAELANYYAGRTLMKEGKFEEAIDYLEKASFDDELMAPLTQCLIGDCYSELENYEEAAEHYWDAATSRENSYSSPKCYMKAALVYEKLGEWEKALKAYQTIKKEYKEAEASKDIQKYISRAETRLNG